MSDIKFVDKQETINLATQFGEYLYNRLPKVYRDYDVEIERLNVETQKKETFKTLKEYLYSFALGGFQPLLEDLEAIINLVDPFKCPSQFLPYLLRHFGLDYIDDIPEKFQRRLVQNVVTLYKKKGTIPAVAFLAKELSGFDVKIEEKSDGSIEFALIKLNAYEDEDAELLLAQDVIQRYIHLFLPAQTKSKVVVVYGFTENIHINAPEKSKDTVYDHAYYDVDEYVDITYIDENGYGSKTGGYSEAFDYLKHVVEDDFNALKLKLEEETHNFSPSLPDLTSLTNCVENEGLPIFTNGISCEDTITEQKLTSYTGEVELSIPASSSSISVNKLVGDGKNIVLPIYKCTTDLTKGYTLEFKYNGKIYGYYTLERDLYASENFPTTFQLDIYNNMVKVYNHYFTETIDESYGFTLYSGYGSYYTPMINGFAATDFIDDIRIICDYTTSFTKVDSIYFQPTTTPQIAFYKHDVYISLSDVITSAESAKEFVREHPITIIAPSAKKPNGMKKYASPLCGQTIAYKKLSSTPVENFTTIECTVYTMDDRKTVFAYESPVFMQNSTISIGGDYGLKVFPETEASGSTIKVLDHLNGADIPNYKLYGNSTQETRSGKNLLPYPYSRTTTTTNGVTFTDNGDGSVTVNGTATTAHATWYFYSDTKNLINGLKIGDKITVSINCDKTWVQSPATMNIVCNYYDSTSSMKSGYCIVNSTTKSCTVTIGDDWVGIGMYIVVYKGQTVNNITVRPQVELGSTATEYEQYGAMPSPDFPSEIQSVGDLVTDETSEYYGKYDIPIIVRGKNLLPNSDWMSGQHSDGFNQSRTAKYITEYTQNSISFNLTAWTGVSSPRFPKDSVKRIVFKINQNQINSDDGYINFYIIIQGYDNDNNKTGNQFIYNNAVADTAYVFDISAISAYNWYADSTQFSFCILARKNAMNNLKVYDIAYYADTDTAVYEPYSGETKHIYLNEPLRKVGDYADYIDFKNQKVVRNVYKQLLNVINIYKKLKSVIRIGCNNGIVSQKYDTHILSTIFNYNYDWFANTECIFHHNQTKYNYYWSIYWNRLGLTYDGTNVYRTDDTSQTPLTDREIISIAKEWLSKLSDKDKEIYVILDTPTEESISLPNLTAPNSEIMDISLNTSVQPSQIDLTYYQNTPIQQDSEIVYDLGIPLVSFGGYSESIEKIDGKYYLRSDIKEVPLEYMYNNRRDSSSFNEYGRYYVGWFSIRDVNSTEKTPVYFNMSPCKTDVDVLDPYIKENGEYVPLSNYVDIFDFMCLFSTGIVSSGSGYSHDINVNQFGFWSGTCLGWGLDYFKRMYDNMFRYSDIPPKFYIYDRYNKYGGSTLTEITDKEVINKLNLLPIPKDYAIISSKGIKYSTMDISSQSKRYY